LVYELLINIREKFDALESSERSKLEREIDDLKLAFNALNEEMRSTKFELQFLRRTIADIQIDIESLKHDLDLEIVSLRTYAKIVSKIESMLR
jgi:septal ring factor EnvC (AmiA/AmiB activator)